MHDVAAALGIAAAAFVSTNVDDLLLLALFFSRSGSSSRQVVAGQYVGIAALVLLSLAIAGLAQAVSTEWTHWLGLLPVAIGVKWLLDLMRSTPDEPATVDPSVSATGRLALSVAAVTFANGGDNIGVYTPLFASSTVAEALLTVGVFAVLTGVWCLSGFVLARSPLLASHTTRFGRVLAPLVLIGIGLGIVLA